MMRDTPIAPWISGRCGAAAPLPAVALADNGEMLTFAPIPTGPASAGIFGGI